MNTDGSGQNVEEEEFEKTVQVVGYLDFPAGMKMREIGDVMFPQVDWYERNEFETESKVVNVMGLSYKVGDDLHDAISNANSGEVSTDVITERKTPYANATKKVAKKIWTESDDDLPDTILGEYESRPVLGSYRNEAREKAVKVYRYVDKMPMLKEPDEIEKGDLYEDGVDKPVVKFKIKANAESEEDMEEIQVLIIDQFVDLLGTLGVIDTVRWYNCERVEKTTGSCINI